MGVGERGAEPLAKYFQKDEEMIGAAGCSLRMMDNIPQIDVSLLTSPSPATASAESQELGSALSANGFCFLINHGMTREFLDGLRDIMTDFFQLPLEEKRKCKAESSAAAAGLDHHFGYEADEPSETGGPHDWCERLAITLIPESQSQFQCMMPHMSNTIKN
ncbi:unnamed protein product [Linum trigynum]|uniref:Non-haem dioxygenase N-terminal domain-containing protein n=1 Tax=Linum trigynum TaxID=586398 RepID=A0AAV2G1I6_9ROSI